MPCTQKVNDCTPCKSTSDIALQPKKRLGLLAGILLAVLPKCPFCVLAFTSTLALCGKNGTETFTQTHSSPLSLYIALFFCSITLISLALSFKDKRSWYALALALAGTTCIIYSVTIAGGQALYYSGVATILAGIAINMKRFHLLEKTNRFLTTKLLKTNFLTKQ